MRITAEWKIVTGLTVGQPRTVNNDEPWNNREP